MRRFFEKIDCKTARCLICNSDVAFCGNTTNFHRHLKGKHTRVYQREKELANKVVSETLPGSASEDEPDDLSSSVVSTIIIILIDDISINAYPLDETLKLPLI
jgi:hypothetical protein